MCMGTKGTYMGEREERDEIRESSGEWDELHAQNIIIHYL